MARLVFTIAGNRVQGIGYRLFFLNAIKEHGLVGYPVNQGDGKQVRVSVWGPENRLKEFYRTVSIEKPQGAGKVYVSQKIIDNTPTPQSSVIMHEKLDLLIEQTGRFVEEGKQINNTLKENSRSIDDMHKTLKKMPKEIALAIRGT